MRICPSCRTPLTVTRVDCPSCRVRLEGEFHLPRLARLSPEHMRLAEAFLLAGGNLKAMAETVGLSYPTLRKRLDEVVLALQALNLEDDRRAETLLDAVEAGDMPPEEAARIGKEIAGEL